MKKETFHLVIRFLVGLALSLLICAGMIMTGKLGSDKPLLQQASGLKGTETVMTVDGEPVESWEYLYMVTYSAQNLSYYGVTDLSTQLGEGFTAADYVAQQAEAQVKQQAAVRKWAKDMGITLTEDDGATLQQQKEAYGEDLQKVLQINGLTEEQYDQLMSTTLLYNRLYAAYCTTDGALRPSDKDLLALAEEHSLMTADVLFISTAELDDAAKADAKALMGDYARQLSTADDKAAAFAALEAGENVTVLASNTYDGCDETTLNKALAALAEKYGFADVSALAKDIAGASAEDLTACMELYNRGYMYDTALSYYIAPTEEDVEAYFTEHESDYAEAGITRSSGKLVDIRHILLIPQVPEDGTGTVTVAPDGTVTCSEDLWDACLASAQTLVEDYEKAVSQFPANLISGLWGAQAPERFATK